MLYHILRNNIESGPFTKEEIIRQGILPTDQVRLDGQTDWHTPDSFSELKNIAGSISKPKYKITADKKLVEIKNENNLITPSTDEQAAGQTPFKRTPSAIPKKRQQEPRTTNLHKEIKTEVPAPASTVRQSVSHIEQAPTFEKRKKVMPAAPQQPAKEQHSSFFKEFLLPIVIIGGIGFISWWGYKKYTTTGNSQSVAAAPVLPDTTGGHQPIMADSPRQAIAHAAQQGTIHNTADSTRKAKSDSSTLLLQVKNNDSSIVKQPALNKSAEPVKKEPSDSEPLAVTAEKTAVVKKEKKDVEVKKEPVKPEPAKAKAKTSAQKTRSVGDYVQLSLNKTPATEIKNIKIKVQNISEENLNIAVIEVKYFDSDGKFIKGETLQASNIGAGKSVTIKVPNSKDATKISYKASLISGDNVYLMGQ